MMNYFVMSNRDVGGEGLKDNTRHRMIYDSYKGFRDYEKAREFASQESTSILAKSTPLSDSEKAMVRDKDKPYVVAGYFPYKYKHYSYDGSSDCIPTHEVMRSSESELEGMVEKLLKEGAEKVYVGVELRTIGGLL